MYPGDTLAVLSSRPCVAAGLVWAFRLCDLLLAQQAVYCLHGLQPAQPGLLPRR